MSANHGSVDSQPDYHKISAGLSDVEKQK